MVNVGMVVLIDGVKLGGGVFDNKDGEVYFGKLIMIGWVFDVWKCVVLELDFFGVDIFVFG